MWRFKQVFKWQVCVQVRWQAIDTITYGNINAKNSIITEWRIQYSVMLMFEVVLDRYLLYEEYRKVEKLNSGLQAG